MNELDKAALLERAKRDYLPNFIIRCVWSYSHNSDSIYFDDTKFIIEGVPFIEDGSSSVLVKCKCGAVVFIYDCDSYKWAEILPEEPKTLKESDEGFYDLPLSESKSKIQIDSNPESQPWFRVQCLEKENERLQSENKEFKENADRQDLIISAQELEIQTLKEYKEKVQAVIDKLSDAEVEMRVNRYYDEHGCIKGTRQMAIIWVKATVKQFKLND